MSSHEIALWAGVSAFFSSLLAMGIIDIFNPDEWVQFIGALILAFITAVSSYARNRYIEAKKEKEYIRRSKG